MKTIITIVLSLVFVTSYAQTGILMDRYYMTGSLALGKQQRVFADSSVWLEVGRDTTKKGMILPRVVLDSIHTKKRGVFVYDLKDSVLYHFDSNKRIRYMTYRDTLLVKQLIAQNTVPVDTNVVATKNYVTAQNYLKQGGNTFGTTLSVGTTDCNPVDFKACDANAGRIFTNGNWKLGTIDADNGSKLQVNGNIRSTGYIGSARTYVNNTFDFGGTGQYITGSGGGGNFDFNNGGGGGFRYRWFQNGSQPMTLTENNHLLLGTTVDDAAYHLNVNGAVRSHQYIMVGSSLGSYNSLYINGLSGNYGTIQRTLVNHFSLGWDSNHGSTRLGTAVLTWNTTGQVTINGTLKTAQPSPNGAGEIRLGKIITGAPVEIQTNKFFEIQVDGVVYKLAIAE